MFGEIAALLKILLEAVKSLSVVSEIKKARSKETVVHMYYLLDEIVADSRRFLDWARTWLMVSGGWTAFPAGHGAVCPREIPDDAWQGSIIRENSRYLWNVAKKTKELYISVQTLRTRLGIFVPELPDKLQLRLLQKFTILVFWFEFSGGPNRKAVESLRNRLASPAGGRLHLALDQSKLLLLAGSNALINVDDSSNSAKDKHISGLIRDGEANLDRLEELKEEFGAFLRASFRVEDILGG